MKIKNVFSDVRLGIWFKDSDVKKIRMMEPPSLSIISTVCPDYANDGQRYTFAGSLGSNVSLTAKEHIIHVPQLLDRLELEGFQPEWTILVADLPELIESQQAFYENVAGSKEEYLSRCANSIHAIQEKVPQNVVVKSFSTFYGDLSLDYLGLQQEVASRILASAQGGTFCIKVSKFYTIKK